MNRKWEMGQMEYQAAVDQKIWALSQILLVGVRPPLLTGFPSPLLDEFPSNLQVLVAELCLLFSTSSSLQQQVEHLVLVQQI